MVGERVFCNLECADVVDGDERAELIYRCGLSSGIEFIKLGAECEVIGDHRQERVGERVAGTYCRNG
jgi:hypothetical protein